MTTGIAIMIGVGIGAFCAGVLFFAFKKERGVGMNTDALFSQLELRFAKTSQEALQHAQEQLLTLTRERLSTDQHAARKELDDKKEMIAHMVNEIRKSLDENKERLRQSDEARATLFSSVKQELEFHKQMTGELRGATEDLKKVLSNNQMRGAFGEQVAENLLKMAGFVVGQDYVANQEQESVETRPDFTLFLPDKTRVNIDVKFPYTALMKMSSTEEKTEKEHYFKQFIQDVKQKVKQVSTREYINPQEKTLDFVMLFIPNEMIFSFIYDQMHEVWEEAMVKKVILAGPFSFTAILRMIKQAYSNFRYQENLQHVIGLIQKFEAEYEKYSEEMDKLGDRLQLAVKQFDSVSGTRHRALTRVMDQIRQQGVLEENEETKLLE
jgi:DNA recombination protein RmuC